MNKYVRVKKGFAFFRADIFNRKKGEVYLFCQFFLLTQHRARVMRLIRSACVIANAFWLCAVHARRCCAREKE